MDKRNEAILKKVVKESTIIIDVIADYYGGLKKWNIDGDDTMLLAYPHMH